MILLLCSIRFTAREGNPVLVIRCLSITLLALSSVQLVSALKRMNMYIQAYGLSELRYFVTAFMILIAVFFVFFLIREFTVSFPLFRSMIFAGTTALLILNFTVPDARIAQYNIDQYLSGSLHSLDVDYIQNSLSADAAVILLQNETAIVLHDENMKSKMTNLHDSLIMDNVLYMERVKEHWKFITLSDEIL